MNPDRMRRYVVRHVMQVCRRSGHHTVTTITGANLDYVSLDGMRLSGLAVYSLGLSDITTRMDCLRCGVCDVTP